MKRVVLYAPIFSNMVMHNNCLKTVYVNDMRYQNAIKWKQALAELSQAQFQLGLAKSAVDNFC